MNRIHDSILGTIGNTPIVRIRRLAPEHVNLYVKFEAFNPMGSVKDRMALSIIEAAERSGALKPGQTVVEATSGNTGIGLAMVCAAKGYPLVVTMAESFSIERRRILRFLGARVVLTPAEKKGTGMYAKAVELAEKHGWFQVRQFENEANPDVHMRTTAVEILDAFGDSPLDVFVTGYGTGGTLQGTGRVFRERSPGTRIVVCEPENAPLLGSGVEQQRHGDGSPAASHPKFTPHPIQGWTPDFIPKIVGDAQAMGLVDEVLPIAGSDALKCSRQLARKEGIFTGISGGATFAGALRACENAAEGANVLCMLPDTAERYLTTPLFEDIPADMNDEELEISRSTPGFRFDAATPPPPPPAQSTEAQSTAVQSTVAEPDPQAEAFYQRAISDSQQPVVLFALAWCEFCWSVRRLFAAMNVPFRSVDLDSPELQKDEMGTRLRAVLLDRLGTPTIPQLFVGGEHVGGATDTFEACADGRLLALLKKHGVRAEQPEGLDPFAMLPGWLHAR